MAGNISRENGKKGGRPKGYAALQAEKARMMIAAKLEKELSPIVLRAIKDAKKGDRFAREWLTERAYGKAKQFIEVEDPDGALKTVVVLKSGTNVRHRNN